MSLNRRSLLLGGAAGEFWNRCRAAAPLASTAGGRRALVIGNRAYPGRELVNSVNDAVDMQSALKGFGFSVTIRADAALARMRESIDAFVRELSSDDVGVFYFSGHGMQIDGRNLLVPVDFVMRTEAEAANSCVVFDDVQDRLQRSPAALSILIMDACRNNPFPRARSWAKGLAMVEARLGSYVALAASPGQTASDNVEGRNGLFTQYVLSKMKAPPPLSSLFRDVRQLVYESSKQTQLPFLQDQLSAEFYFRTTAQPVLPGSDPSSRLLSEGLQAYARQDCVNAFNLLDKAVRQDSENPFAHNAAGMALVCLGRHAQALIRFNMAIGLKPDYGTAYWNRGNTYMKDGKYDLAIEDFNWAIDEEPLNSMNFTMRGWTYLLHRRYTEAKADFHKSIDLNPSDALAWHGRGVVAHRMGQYQEALAALAEAQFRNSRLPGLDEDIARARARAR